jgi:hypothetical protein
MFFKGLVRIDMEIECSGLVFSRTQNHATIVELNYNKKKISEVNKRLKTKNLLDETEIRKFKEINEKDFV